MPVPLLKHLAKETGKTLAQAEEAWEAAKREADKKFKSRDSHYWSYVTATTKRKLGIRDEDEKGIEKSGEKS